MTSRIFRFFPFATFFLGAWITLPEAAFAAAASSSLSRKATIIAGVVGVASLVAIWLYDMAKKSAQTETRRRESGHSMETFAEDDGFEPIIDQEISKLTRSVPKRQEAARQLSQLMSGRIEARINEVKREMQEEFSGQLEEKTRAAQIMRKKYQEVAYEKQQTESVLRSVSEGVVVVDAKGSIVFMNPAAERLMGEQAKDRLGRPLKSNMSDDQLISLVNNESDDAGQKEIEVNANLDQTRRVLRASNAVVQDEDGKTVGMVSVLSDVTKQRELDRLKDEFVSKVTHELRTPIVAIKHSLAVLEEESEGKLDEAQLNFLGIANRNLERLGKLVDELLDLAKLEARKVELDYKNVSMQEVLQTAQEGLQAWAQSKSIHLDLQADGQLPQIEMDADRIIQVLNNLMGNAIKFTPEGGKVTCSAKAVNGGTEVEISVTDTGVGISKEDLSKLFQKFQQVGKGEKRSGVSGTGLGLTIAKEIVTLHGGKIWAESEPGQGASFKFTLPLNRIQQESI